MDMTVKLFDADGRDIGSYSGESMDTFWKRFRGLMTRAEQPVGDAAVFDGCSSIHMFFMRFPIDVIWFAPSNGSVHEVVGVSEDVRPWTLAFGPKGTKGCIEVAAGSVPTGLSKVVFDSEGQSVSPAGASGFDYRDIVRERVQITRMDSESPHFGGAAHVLVR